MPMTNEQDQPAIVSNAVSSEVERSDTEGDLELEPGDAEDVVGGYCVWREAHYDRPDHDVSVCGVTSCARRRERAFGVRVPRQVAGRDGWAGQREEEPQSVVYAPSIRSSMRRGG